MSGRSGCERTEGENSVCFIYNIHVCLFLASAEPQQVDLVSCPRIGTIILSGLRSQVSGLSLSGPAKTIK